MSSRLSGMASRGGAINILFGVGIQAMAAVQTLVVGRLLGPEILGLYALATGGVVIGTTLKDFGIAGKLVQERDVDLYTMYGAAFTLELLLAGGAFLLVAGGVGPILAFAYHRAVLVPVVAALSLSVFTTALLYLPAALPYREMNFVRRNLIIAVGPGVTFVVTVPAALAGLGIWSLVAGDLAGFAAAAFVVFQLTSVRPHIVFDRTLMRGFVSFGGPLWGAGLLSMVSGWISTVVVSGVLGVPSVGFFSMSQSWTSQTVQVDGFLSDALFPALCSIQSSMERQRRAFIYVCRLSMGWAAPAGAGLVVFAAPLINVLLGHRWIPVIFLLQAGGAGVIVMSVAYSWNTFYAARGDNRPVLVASVLGAVWLLGVFVPLTVIFGLHGVAGAVVVLSLVTFFVRQYYLRKIFGPLHLVTMIWREWAAAGAGAAVVEATRFAGWQAVSLAGLAGQAALFGVVAFGLFAGLERRLLLDVLRGIRGPRVSEGPAAAEPTRGPLTVPAGRSMSFPVSVTADPDGRTVWATTRDWPALGRIDIQTLECSWTPLPPNPCDATPDGEGGCWTALTRSSAVAHVDSAGRTRIVSLPKSRELRSTAVGGDAVWVVDAAGGRLWRVGRDDLSLTSVVLPEMHRPDRVGLDGRGELWVADSRSTTLSVVDEATLAVRTVVGPHPTGAIAADWSGRGMWLADAGSPKLTLVGWDGAVRSTLELPGRAAALSRVSRGVLLATFPERDAIGIVRTARAETVEIALGDASRPMGAAYVDGSAVVALAGSSEIALVRAGPELRSSRSRPALVG